MNDEVDSSIDDSPPAGARGAYEKNHLWNKDTLVVCWTDEAMAPENDEGRALAKERVLHTWDAVSRIDFTGWQRCSETPDPDISITVTEQASAHSEFGPDSRDVFPSMRLYLRCIDPPRDCGGGLGDLCDDDDDNEEDDQPHGGQTKRTVLGPPPLTAEQRNCVGATAIHEFGHALGLRHEHARPEHGGPNCQQTYETLDQPGFADGEAVWPYDVHSIMNYCREGGLNQPVLSDTDVLTIQTLYPSQVISFGGPDLTLGTGVWGPGVYESPSSPTLFIASLAIPPGYDVSACNANRECIQLSHGVVRSLPEAWSKKVTHLEVRQRVLAFDEQGFMGHLKRLWYGTARAEAGGLGSVGNNAMSSIIVPPGLSVRLCDQSGSGNGGGACTSFDGSPRMARVNSSMPTSFDNMVSFVDVAGRVVVYDTNSFRGDGLSFPIGVLRASQSLTWAAFMPNLHSFVVPQGLKVKACTNEDGVRGCTVFTSSVPFSTAQYPYFEVQNDPIFLPPPFDPTN